jgi:hypothetical protein
LYEENRFHATYMRAALRLWLFDNIASHANLARDVSLPFESEFSVSVMAVPPLARRPDLALGPAENRKLRSYRGGRVRTLLYGGKTNRRYARASRRSRHAGCY